MTYYSDDTVTLHHGNSLEVLRTLASGSVDCCVTSPPYWGLRDYGVDGQIGAEATPSEYVANLRNVFREVRRVLADDATCWINLGDSFSHSAPGGSQGSTGQRASRTFTAVGAGGMNGLPDKNLMFMPHRVATALQDDGWIARNAVVWNAPNRMPESVTDRLSTRYEMVFMFSKSRKYWFDLDPIREASASEYTLDAIAKAGGAGGTRPAGNNFDKAARHRDGTRTPLTRADRAALVNPLGKNPGDVWNIATTPYASAHFAVFPPELPRRCIVAGCKPGGVVLDPFHGSGTTGMVATRNGRKYIGIELNKEYLDLSLKTRLADGVLDFEEGA